MRTAALGPRCAVRPLFRSRAARRQRRPLARAPRLRPGPPSSARRPPFVQHHTDLCAHPGRVAAGGCRTIEEIAEQRALDPGVQQPLHHVGGVAAPATAGIVGDVGQAHGGAAPFPPAAARARDGLVERREQP